MDINPKNLESSDEEEDERKDPEDGTKTKQEGLFSKESLFSRAGCGWNLNYCCTIYINGRGIRSRSAGAVGISAASTAIIGTSTGTVAAVVTQKINNAKSKS
ncbi:unnamed protein product [Lepeophtheirus salmonis]|uniref:(salmon louse) hypothetical protein n=1 Tax=Lepeophtheirus salmonis TaxID=72036 RepID=A0A7R8H8T2_LEPSM|nr:unnamed protein product [Lepeophtheirus salmonis]CAF2945001.1 unnamed protein product [Lepeophtheirus salmonis]